MRSAKDFFKPLAIGAPEPVREIPFKPSRMIHFFDPSNAKVAAKVPDIAKQVDVMFRAQGTVLGHSRARRGARTAEQEHRSAEHRSLRELRTGPLSAKSTKREDSGDSP